MSRQNKVNKGQYDQAGRLTPDDMAREQKKMQPARPDDRADDRTTGRARQQAAEPVANPPRSGHAKQDR